MIHFDKFTLDNGLTVIVHQDKSTPIVVMDILYRVGARDEHPDKTGFAHLFEHLMFGGSENIPSYDAPLEKAGGENNAFTNSDVTNYYLTIPRENMETAFWLESDRMLNLAFSDKSLEVQRQVVVEEFKQSYLNQPYGDVWLLLKPLAYTTHPYQWNTIGKEIAHIENATMDDVKDFYGRFYNPNNAIMVLGGNIETDEANELTAKWFGSIPAGPVLERKLHVEPRQTAPRRQSVERDVPAHGIYLAFHMCHRLSADYQATDIISDILSGGTSGRLYRKWVKEKALFTELDAYLTGDLDNGLFIFSGKLSRGIDFEAAEEALWGEMELLKNVLVSHEELEKVKNKMESTMVFGEVSLLNKATNLALFENLSSAGDINHEVEKYRSVTPEQIQRIAREIFTAENSNTLIYKAKHL
jgi:predicted Zn-dependent peptidase